ncbi:MAG TPA: hypothetical protein VG457_13550, partial [Planctomycetota bacterium]|nr:hypothetical protein [Planctomycetota bacterium]
TEEKSAVLEETVLRKLSIKEGILLAQAHPEETGDPWGRILAAVEESVSDRSLPLSDEDRSALTKALTPWKPKQK